MIILSFLKKCSTLLKIITIVLNIVFFKAVSICVKVKFLLQPYVKTRTRYNLLMAYMPTNFRNEIQYLLTRWVLLALLNTLFIIHSKLSALKYYGDPFLARGRSIIM